MLHVRRGLRKEGWSLKDLGRYREREGVQVERSENKIQETGLQALYSLVTLPHLFPLRTQQGYPRISSEEPEAKNERILKITEWPHSRDSSTDHCASWQESGIELWTRK